MQSPQSARRALKRSAGSVVSALKTVSALSAPSAHVSGNPATNWRQ